MMKHLFWYPWVMAALVLGILACIGLIVHMLFFSAEMEFIPIGAQMVKGALNHAMA